MEKPTENHKLPMCDNYPATKFEQNAPIYIFFADTIYTFSVCIQTCFCLFQMYQFFLFLLAKM